MCGHSKNKHAHFDVVQAVISAPDGLSEHAHFDVVQAVINVPGGLLDTGFPIAWVLVVPHTTPPTNLCPLWPLSPEIPLSCVLGDPSDQESY